MMILEEFSAVLGWDYEQQLVYFKLAGVVIFSTICLGLRCQLLAYCSVHCQRPALTPARALSPVDDYPKLTLLFLH